jgi:ATP10 protein
MKRRIVLVILVALPAVAYVFAKPNRCSDSVSVVADADATQFPTVRAKTLAGRCVTFPAATKGKVGIIFVAFEQSAQTQIDSWVTPMLSNYLDQADVSYYEIPMISGGYKPVSRFIDSGMRSGVPSDLHDRTATFYGNQSVFFETMKIVDSTRAYLFVLSRDGRIVYRTSGASTDDHVREAIEAVETERAKAT